MDGRRLRSGSLIYLGVALLFVILGLVGWREELTDLVADARGFAWRWQPGMFALAVLVTAPALVATGATWVYLYRASGAGMSYRDGTAAWIGSNLGRYIPGKIWQLAGLASYAKASGHPGAGAISTSILLQAVTLLTGLAWGAAVLGARLLGSDRTALIQLAGVVVLLIVLVQPSVIGFIARIAGRLLNEPSAGAIPGTGHTFRAAAVLFLVWALYGLGFWLLCRATVGGQAAPSFVESTGIFAASYIMGYLVLVAPGGILVREGAMAALLVAAAGLPVPVAAALAVGARIWVTLAELFALATGFVSRRRG